MPTNAMILLRLLARYIGRYSLRYPYTQLCIDSMASGIAHRDQENRQHATIVATNIITSK
jgi:hypothetical protein